MNRAPTPTGRTRLGSIAALLAAVGIVLLLPFPTSDAGSPATKTSAAGETPTSTITEPTGGPGFSPIPRVESALTTAADLEPAPTSEVEPWRPVLEGFSTDFAQPGTDWATRISQWTTSELAAGYTDTDPTQLITGIPTAYEQALTTGRLIDAIVTYDTGDRIAVRVENSDTGWVITRVQPE